MRLIGIHGFKQSGKDTLGRLLVEEYGYRRIAFADRLKEAVSIIFSVPREHLFGTEEDKNRLTAVRWIDLREVDRKERSDPEFLTVRELMQTFGTEVCRRHIPDIWFRYLPEDDSRPLVVTDLRFLNEAEFLKSRGAVLIEVIRKGLNAQGHESEAGLPPGLCDHTIENDSSLEDFLNRGRQLFDRIAGNRP